MKTAAQYKNTRIWSGSKSEAVPFLPIIAASHRKSTRNRPYLQGWQELVQLIVVVVNVVNVVIVVNFLATKAVVAWINNHFIRVGSLRSEVVSFVLSNRTQSWIRTLHHLYSRGLSISMVALASPIYLPGESGKVSKEVDRTFHCTPTRITANSFITSLLIS